jgi:hypothetical protein
MLASLTPTVDYKQRYILQHSWSIKKHPNGLQYYIRNDAPPPPLFSTIEKIAYNDQEYEGVLKRIVLVN